MSAQRAHRNKRDGPDTPHKEFSAETHPEFFYHNVCFVNHYHKRFKTERAETGGRPTGLPHFTTDSTPTNAPAVHDAKEPTSRATYGTVAMMAGQAWKRLRPGNRGPRPTVPMAKIERDDTDGSLSPSTSYDSPPPVDHERDEPPAGAAVPEAFYTDAASGETLDPLQTWIKTGEGKTRVDRVYFHDYPVYQPEATLNHAPLARFAYHTHHHTTNTTHNPAPASIVLPATAFRVQGGSGQEKKNNRSGINNPSSPGMRFRHLRPTSPTSVHLIRSTERRASGRRAGAARHPPLCTCPQEGGSKKDCPHKRPGPSRRPEHNTNLLWQDEH